MDVTAEKFFGEVKGEVVSDYALKLTEIIESGAKNDSVWESAGAFLKEAVGDLLVFPKWTGIALAFIAILLIFEIIKGAFGAKRVNEAIGYTLRLSMAASVLVYISELINQVVGYMQETAAFLGVLAPTLGTLTAASGNVASAKISTVFFTVAVSSIQILIYKIVPVVCSFFFGIAIVDAANFSSKMTILSQTLKRIFYTAFSIFLGLFFIALSTQSLSAAGTDSFSAKALRLLVGNTVPIVGGTIGDALRLVGGSLVAVKNTVGTAAVVFLLSMYLPPLLILWGNGVLISIVIFLCDYFPLSAAKETFVHIKHALGFMLASFTAVFVIGMVNIGIFMGTVPAIIS